MSFRLKTTQSDQETAFTVRQARADDFLSAAALDREAWRQNRDPEFIPDGEHVWRIWCEHALAWMAERDRELLGVILAFPSARQPGLLCLHKIMVREEARGQGIGCALMRVLLEELDRQGEDAFLTVDPLNERAIRLYHRWGFTDRQFVAGFYRANEDRLVLTRHAPAAGSERGENHHAD